MSFIRIRRAMTSVARRVTRFGARDTIPHNSSEKGPYANSSAIEIASQIVAGECFPSVLCRERVQSYIWYEVQVLRAVRCDLNIRVLMRYLDPALLDMPVSLLDSPYREEGQAYLDGLPDEQTSCMTDIRELFENKTWDPDGIFWNRWEYPEYGEQKDEDEEEFPEESPEEEDERFEREGERIREEVRIARESGEWAREETEGELSPDEIDDIVDRELQAFEAEWERTIGLAETFGSGDHRPTYVKVVRRDQYGQVVEIQHREVFLRVRAHAHDHVELPSLRSLGGKRFEVSVPGVVLGVRPQPDSQTNVGVGPTDICRFFGKTEAHESDLPGVMNASVCSDEETLYGLRLHVQIGHLEVDLRAVGGLSKCPALRIGHRGSWESVEVDIPRLFLEPGEDG